MTKAARKTAPTAAKGAETTLPEGEGVNAAAEPADEFPLTKRATAQDCANAGLRNGMSAADVEAALSRVMR